VSMQAEPINLPPDRIRREPWGSLQNRDLSLTAGDAARAWLLRNSSYPALVILPDKRLQSEFLSDLRALAEEGGFVSNLPEIPLTIDGLTHKGIRIQRGEEISRWKKAGGTLICTPGALMGPFALAEGNFMLRTSEEPGRASLIEWLLLSGYERTETVWSPGQFVVRGSIVDIFDPAIRNPLRVEFLDERIESLRFFRPETQRSIGSVGEIAVSAVKEGETPILENLCPESCRVILFEPSEIASQADHYRWVWEGLRKEAGIEEIPEWDALYVRLSRFPLLRIKSSVERVSGRIDLGRLPSFKGRRQALESALADWQEQGLAVSLYTMNNSIANRFVESGALVREAPLSSGFISPSEKTVIICDSDISGITTLPPSEGNATPPLEWSDRLAVGDWVVHEDYGIGRFVGIENIPSVGSEEQEYLVIEYSGGQRLLVPPFLLWKITPYLAPRGAEPTADSLKSGIWKKSLSRVRRKVQEAAQELMETYARREILPGFAFPKNGPLSSEVEKSFPYPETADQLRAIEEIKQDMEKPHPMDRLLVGDVGFGKTEVAFRAAVKAAESGKQVAVLVPTTLLAQQHHETFNARVGELPIHVESLCRFVPKKKQAEIVRMVAEGRVEILIGTHRLVQNDVRFKDLGLVIVDEEHRFGVLHKEHAKGLKPDVDVLMMSATPIPRTLFLSLGGLRDISIIATPPHRRYPVVTVVSPWREDLVGRGILREKARGGQTFFVHNRVADIDARAGSLRLLFPSLKIEVAHGQMAEGALEKTMLRFNSGETDILVCTTIIESGLDIPRANTLIVDDAHELGLAQLYQLRGRVGRREEQAFAYFLYPRETALAQEARERLEAIGELSEPGSGYELAQRDLEIRGGGQVVGTAQHGHVERVGYHLYCRMLEEQVSVLRGQGRSATRIEIQASLQVPASYIPQPSVRIALYRRLLRAQDRNDLESVRAEVRDRFGPIPAAVCFLFDVATLRLEGERLGIDSIHVTPTETLIRGPMSGFLPGQRPRGWRWGKNWAAGPGGHEGIGSLADLVRTRDDPQAFREDENEKSATT
jgi:transcription-repair coupling factor (superfamily II helicase)